MKLPHVTHANTQLIVIADADDLTVVERRGDLQATPPPNDNDPLVVLIPRRHIETWIRAALGQSVNETDSYKNPVPKREEIRKAAKVIHGWARDNPRPSETCVASLKGALREWRKIG